MKCYRLLKGADTKPLVVNFYVHPILPHKKGHTTSSYLADWREPHVAVQ
jgi:hypothetical protein